MRMNEPGRPVLGVGVDHERLGHAELDPADLVEPELAHAHVSVEGVDVDPVVDVLTMARTERGSCA
jgi:hypothetical protein